MFLQRTTSRAGGKVYVTWLVREGFRTEKGPRSRTVCNVSALPEEARQALRLALQGKQLVPLEDIALEGAFDYGGLALLRDAWQRLGLETLFDDVPGPRDRALLKALVFARLLFPSSKLGLAEQARATLLAAACGLDQNEETFDEDDLYRAMDALNGTWVSLEKRLYARAIQAPLRVVLYDLTSVYFEGRGPRHLARFGYSRDHRGDRRQVVLAVATTSEGIPVHLEVLKGHRGDATTLRSLLATLRRRFGIEEAIFAFDGGIASRVNLAAIEAEKLQYVTRLSMGQLATLLKTLPQDQQPELFDCTRVVEVTLEGVRYVVAGGEMRRHRDRERRQARLARGEAVLQRIADVRRKQVDPQKLASQAGRALQREKAHKYFEYFVDETGCLRWHRKDAVIAEEARLDGWYLLQTNLAREQGDKEDVLAHYKQLAEVEAAFRQLKEYLEVRPVFHHRVDRVRNHIRICFIAYWISARLAEEWRQKGETRRVVEILRSLQKIRVGWLSLHGQPIAKRLTQIPPDLNQTLSQLKLLHLFSKPPAWADL
jgi:transposase